MGNRIKLTDADLEGAQVIEPAGRIRLSADDLSGAVEVKPQAAPLPPAPPPPPPSLYDRFVSGLEGVGHTFAGAGHALADTAEYQAHKLFHPLEHLAEVRQHPLEALLPGIFGERRAQTDQFVRGIDDMVTLGYGQQVADALRRKVSGITPEEQQAMQTERRTEAPGYRELGSIAGAYVPGAANLIGKAGGAVVGKVTGGLRAANPMLAATLGAGRAALGYEATVPLQAGLSAGAAGHRLQAVKDAATDPTGLIIAGGTGALAEGGRAALRKLAESAPERILGSVKVGDEGIAGATKTAGKILARDKADIVQIITEDPDVGAIYSAPAKKALPVLHAKLNEWGAKLDPLYDVIDKATGGINLRDFVKFLDGEEVRLAKDPLNEKYVQAVQDIRDSALNAWSPQAAHLLASNPGVPRGRLLQYVTDKVPSRALRAMTTRLQTRGSQVINPLNPGEASIMKADMADMVKGFLDQHLDVAANTNPQVQAAVDAIRNDINPRYSALKNITKAVEQRGQNEATRSKSLRGLGAEALGAGGAMHALATGHPVRAAAIYAGSKAVPAIAAVVEPRVNVALARMAQQPAQTGPMRSAAPLLQAAESRNPIVDAYEAKRRRDEAAAAHLQGGP